MFGLWGFTFFIDILTLVMYKISKFRLKKINPYKPVREVSVIIPAHNEEDHIRTTLQSLTRETYPIKNIVVCGDKESYVMKSVLETIAPAYKNVIYLECPCKSKAKKINHAVATMCSQLGEFTYIRDARVTSYPDCIERMVACFGSKNVAAVTSYGRLAVPKNFLSRAYYYGKSWINEIGRFRKDAQEKRSSIFVICGASTMYRTSVLQKIPIPCRSLTEDTYHTWLLQMNNYTIRVADDAVVQAPDIEGDGLQGIKNQLRQSYRWSSGTMQCFYSQVRNNKKAIPLFYTTIFPGFFEAITYSLAMVILPVLLFFSPLFLWGFMIGDTLFSLLGTLIILPNKFLKTIAHYPQIIFFKYLNSAVFLGAFFVVTYQWLLGKTNVWFNEWNPLTTETNALGQLEPTHFEITRPSIAYCKRTKET